MLFRIAPVLALAAVLQADARSDVATIGFPAELRFSSGSGARSIPFRCPSNGTPAGGSALHLFLQHSPGLDGNRCFLSISLNYGILRSVRLDEDNQRPTELVVPLPAAQLKGVNELSLSVEQFATPGIAPDSVWTAIGPQSYISLQYRRGQPVLDLGSLPSGPDLDVLIPERASTATLQATALLVARFANRLAPEPLAVRAVRSPRAAVHPLLIAGTPAEQPELRPNGTSESTAWLSEAHLCVTGATPAGVLRAARSLPNATGRLARFTSDPEFRLSAPRAWKGFLPPRSRFALAELNGNEPAALSPPGFSISLPLNATPDAVFLGYGLEIAASFAFDPGAYERNPELVLELNGTPLRRATLRELSRRPQFSLTLPIPAALLRANNVLRILVRGSLDSLRAAGWLLPDTQFYLPRDYRVALPDLALLREHLYPFSLKPDLSDTLIVLPDTVGEPAFAALLQLAAALGRLMPADAPAFQLRRLHEVTSSDVGGNHLILLGGAAALLGNAKRPPSLAQEMMSPWNSEKCVLSVSPHAVSWLFSDAVLARLSGDTVYAGPKCAALAARRTLEESSLLTHLQARLRANWIALPAVLSLVSGILFVGLRLALAHYKRVAK